MRRRSYVTKQHVAVVRERLRSDHWQLLSDAARLQLMSGEQLRRLHYDNTETGRRMARLDLAQLAERRVLARLHRRVGGVRAGSDGYVYGLDVVGQRLIWPDRRRHRPPWTPQPAYLRHALTVSELYTRLREHEQHSRWELTAFDAEPLAWRRFHGPGGSLITLKPDAFVTSVVDDYEDRFFIEVDCATESMPRITDKARLYVRYWQSGREQANEGVFPLILFVAPDEHRRDQIIDALGSIDPDHWRLFASTRLDDAVGLITGHDDAAETGS